MIDIEGIKKVLIYLKKERLAMNDSEFASKNRQTKKLYIRN